jgi:hypothetical protein
MKSNKSKAAPLTESSLIEVGHGSLMDRVVSILEQARDNVARSVNSNMVLAYWLIGREMVVALQGGEERAEYGERLLGELSEQLTKRYGRGFSVTNLRYFRLFYQAFNDRAPEIHHATSDELGALTQEAVLDDLTMALEKTEQRKGFSPNLSWTHYQRSAKSTDRLSVYSMRSRQKKPDGAWRYWSGKFTVFYLPVYSRVAIRLAY